MFVFESGEAARAFAWDMAVVVAGLSLTSDASAGVTTAVAWDGWRQRAGAIEAALIGICQASSRRLGVLLSFGAEGRRDLAAAVAATDGTAAAVGAAVTKVVAAAAVAREARLGDPARPVWSFEWKLAHRQRALAA